MLKEDRKKILNMLLDLVADIGNKEFQQRVWINAEGPECIDFDETCCIFFHDVEDVLNNYQDYQVKDNQYQILKKFRDVFYTFSRNNDWPADFIDSPEWDEVTKLAKDVLIAFDYAA